MRITRLAPLLLACTLGPPAHAQEPSVYQQPSAEMRAVLDAKGLPTRSLSPDQRTLASIRLKRHRSIEELARPVLRLAGKRIDAGASSPQLVSTIEALTLQTLATPGAPERVVALPAGGDFHQMRWSPDGQRFLLNRRTPTGTELWVGDVATARVQQLRGIALNTVLEFDVAWLDADEIVALTVPERRGHAPVFSAPTGPAVQESIARTSPERTLQDLLKNSQDEALFVHHATSALRRIKLSSGASREVGKPGLYVQLQALGAPAGHSPRLLVERLVPPFSYQVGWSDFARQAEVLDSNGAVLRELGRIKLREDVVVGGVVTGPRDYWGSPLADGAVYWVEALDGGDPRTKVSQRDRLMRLDAPYTAPAVEVHRTAGRLMNLAFLDGSRRAVVSDVDRDRAWLTTELLALDGSAAPQRLQDRSLRDRYRDPGSPLTRMLANGRMVVRVDRIDGGERVLLVGNGAGPQGDRPFIDSFSLGPQPQAKPTRLFQAGTSHYERPLALLADGRLLTTRESFTEPPNVVLRSGAEFAQMEPLTRTPDPTPQLRGIKRELVSFKRSDGVELSFWLYLPADHKAGERRPTLVWAYPQEFTDAAVASQVNGSANRFNTFGGMSPLMLLLDGYVVLMDATMPVVGNPKTVNDSFIEQISANALAIIEKAEALGVSDRKTMVVGGHSYGAFMTANLLAHTDLFKAGIARSGAYNRSLTPFGFQAERRTFWEAQDVYLKLSPFNFADKIKEPILLIHGEMDDNPGTFPIQSQRLYQALAGTGGTVRYVSLPFESHGYTARESLGHMLREMSDWMQRHTRNPRTPPPTQ
jgi:dipeptidyl aminopeptidase/acylaminoacyl peptidase